MTKVFGILGIIFLIATFGSIIQLIENPTSTSPLVLVFGALTYIFISLFFYTSEVE